MRAICEMPIEIAAGIHTVFADIDDTLTTHGRLPATSYRALERLRAAGIRVAPITGRPAGWCDMIARMWPVDGVVGENGAMYFSYDEASKKMRRAYSASQEERRYNAERYKTISARILKDIPGTAISADQAYREADLAIDFCEDVPPLPSDDVARIKAIFEDEGAVAKVSSIHVNGWFGAYDKLSMARRFADEVLGIDVDADKDRILFCGDSPNDAPMFGHFPNACGVANVLEFKGRLEAEPAWISRSNGGEGFAEIAEHILSARAETSRRLSA
ncbi:HAD family hydrolase [Roseibium sediminis]|uniref:HAD family hydrolase n=1 Tax=Roseibium sediminis TaxID=1775174 RepID=UPI00123E0D8B|nr:HAD-IIB family hydrolase [Roseibium sediminis]